MTLSSDTAACDHYERKQRVAALTMVRDEATMLPRWIDYYGGQCGFANLMVIDDNSSDGSTDDLPCSLYRVPAGPMKTAWATARKHLVNGFAQGLLASYDVVVFSDVDEFLVPDPARYSGLIDYLGKNSDRRVVAPLAVNVLHNPEVEPALDERLPILAQRRFVKFAPGMCKPLVKRTSAPWYAGLHGIKAQFGIDRELLLLHVKYGDAASLLTVFEQRRALHESDGRGSSVSAWALGPEELLSRLRSWVDTPDGEEVPEFDSGEPDISGVVRKSRPGSFRAKGPQLRAMETSPLRQLPERFRSAF